MTEKNLKNIKAEFKAAGIFYTPPELAETIKSYVDFEPKRAYDPTCGQGNLLAVFGDEVEKYGQELYRDELEKAEQLLTNFHGYAGDTLKDDGFPGEKFDLIVANPPFSIKWEPSEDDIRWRDAPCTAPPGKADYAFMLHILYHLADHGKRIVLEFPGVLYRGQREGKIRQWMVDNNYIERVVHIPGNTFVDTQIATCIIVFNKSKADTSIVFEDRENGLTRTVSRDEVIRNGYTLSVSTYVQKEEVRETVDPRELDNARRSFALKKLRREIEFEITVCKMEGWNYWSFLDDIQEIINEYRLK